MIEEMRLRGGDKNGSKLAKNRTKRKNEEYHEKVQNEI